MAGWEEDAAGAGRQQWRVPVGTRGGAHHLQVSRRAGSPRVNQSESTAKIATAPIARLSPCSCASP